MVPTKLLVGGTVAVGSTATAAVVANKYGLFSTSTSLEGNQNTESNSGDRADNDPNVAGSGVEDAPRAETVDGASDSSTIVPDSDGEPATSQAKTKQQEIKESIKTIGENIEVKIKTDTPEKETLLANEQDGNLEGLSDYLKDEIKEELKSLISEEHKILVFVKNEGTWSYSLKKENIKAWIKNNWGSAVKLSIKNGSTIDVDSLQADENLKKLFETLKKNKELFGNLKSETQEKTIVFKKVSEDFELSHNQVSIEAWVKKTSESAKNLEAWSDGTKQTLSSLEEGELEKLFKSISSETNKGLFDKNQQDTVVVFEKDVNDWKHIKQALKDWNNKESNKKFKLQICKDGQTDEVDIEKAKDIDLTGLLKHLSTDSSFTGQQDSGRSGGDPAPLVFKKTAEKWERNDG